MLSRLVLAIGSAAFVSAHGGVQEYLMDGTYYNGFRPYNTAVGQTTIQLQWATYE